LKETMISFSKEILEKFKSGSKKYIV